MPDVEPVKLIWLVPALNVRLVIVPKFNATLLGNEMLTVEPFRLIVRAVVLLLEN